MTAQRCSIQFRCGLRGDQPMTWIPESSRKRVVTLEVWALAPSCINTKFGPISCEKGRMWFCTTSTYLSAEVSPDENEVNLVVQGNASPNHQRSSAIRNSLQQVRRQISFSSTPPHPDTTICPRKQEFRFIRKHYWGPIQVWYLRPKFWYLFYFEQCIIIKFLIG